MILTLVSWAIFIVFLVLCFFVKDEWGDIDPLIIFTASGLGLIAFAFLLGVLINPTCVKAEILEFNALQETVEKARMNPDISDFELVSIQQKIAEKNEWLVSAKFWAKNSLTNWFWPKDIFSLEPIK